MNYFKEALRGLYVKGYGKDESAKEQLLTLLFIKYISTSPDVSRNSINDYIWQKLIFFEGESLIAATDAAFLLVSEPLKKKIPLKVRDPEVLEVTIHILDNIVFAVFLISLGFYGISNI